MVGTLAGAAAGAAIGGKKHRAGGALIGAATGAIAGGLVGNYLDKQAKEIDAIPGAEVERKRRRAGRELRGRNPVRHQFLLALAGRLRPAAHARGDASASTRSSA